MIIWMALKAEETNIKIQMTQSEKQGVCFIENKIISFLMQNVFLIGLIIAWWNTGLALL